MSKKAVGNNNFNLSPGNSEGDDEEVKQTEGKILYIELHRKWVRESPDVHQGTEGPTVFTFMAMPTKHFLSYSTTRQAKGLHCTRGLLREKL